MKNLFSRLTYWRKPLYYLGLGLGLVLFAQQLWQASQAMRQQAFEFNRPIYLIAAIGVVWLAYALHALAWLQIMQSLGTSINLSAALTAYFITLLPRYIPGSVWGYVSRGEWLRSRYHIPHTVSGLGSVLEMGLTVLTGVTIVITYYIWLNGSPSLHLLIPAIVLLMPWPVQLVFNFVWSKYIAGRITKTSDPIKPLIKLTHWFRIYYTYLVIWGCYGLSLRLLLYAFGFEHQINILGAIFIFSFAWIIGFIVLIAPTGLGIRELALAGLLVAQVGMPNQTASAMAIMSRLSFYLAELIWLVLVGLYMLQGRQNRSPVKNSSERV